MTQLSPLAVAVHGPPHVPMMHALVVVVTPLASEMVTLSPVLTLSMRSAAATAGTATIASATAKPSPRLFMSPPTATRMDAPRQDE